VFEQLWDLVRTRYVYTDYRGLDWQAVHDEYEPKIRAAATSADVYILLGEMIEKLGDQHSSFANPQEVAEDDALQRGDLQLSGIGVLSQEILDTVRVVYVVPGGPADQAGLRAFDIIRAADGTPILSNEDAPRLIRGPAGTAVVLTVETPGSPPRDVTIIRATVTFSFHASARRLPGSNVAYLDLPTFNAFGIAGEVRSEINRLAATGPLDGLIINLRQNGGGLISELNDTLALFLDGGNVGYVVTRENRSATIIPGGQTLPALRGKPIVVLVSNLSASASERFAAAMQYHHRATILGTTTSGNTETVYYHDLPFGARLGLAEETYLLPDGVTSIEDKGVVPDVPLDVAWYDYPVERDPQVLEAVKRIQSAGQQALGAGRVVSQPAGRPALPPLSLAGALRIAPR
jgi:C-terminal peptidase prc